MKLVTLSKGKETYYFTTKNRAARAVGLPQSYFDYYCRHKDNIKGWKTGEFDSGKVDVSLINPENICEA